MKENETEYYLYMFILPQQKIYCAVRSVNGNGFCQCLFAGLICCPHILETNAHALTLHCVGGEIYARQRNSIQSSLLLLAHKKLDMGNFESKQGDFCLRRGVLRWSKSIFIWLKEAQNSFRWVIFFLTILKVIMVDYIDGDEWVSEWGWKDWGFFPSFGNFGISH